MKRKIVKWHLYAGLLFFPCFIIFGVSSLHFNHHFGFMKKSDDTRSFQKQIVLPHYVDNKQFSEEVRDSLQLMGTISPWGMANDSGGFRFVVVHPGCEYGITHILITILLPSGKTGRDFGSCLTHYMLLTAITGQ